MKAKINDFLDMVKVILRPSILVRCYQISLDVHIM